ncbi:hypothetical protein [Xanthobacter autotrophicus]|uniref:hypothetical protein n=1 Tax=Xanthobacter autotrophicus TaxID=280 RepID=UPI00372A9CC2
MTILRFPRLFNSRRAAARPQAAPQPPAEGVPSPQPAAVPSLAEVVNLEERRIPKIPLPWCPVSPYVGAVILGAALASATTAYVAADLFTMPSGFAAAAFAPWSA